MENDFILYSKYLFANGLLNEDGLSFFSDQFRQGFSKYNSFRLKLITEHYFNKLKTSSKSLKSFSKFIYLKYFEIDDKHILKIVRKVFIIYKFSQRKRLLLFVHRWNERILKNKPSNYLGKTSNRSNAIKNDNDNSKQNNSRQYQHTRSYSIPNLKSDKITNLEYCNLLYEDNKKREIKKFQRSNHYSMKLEKECTFSPKINKNYNFLFLTTSGSRHDLLYHDNENNRIKKTLLSLENDKSLDEKCTFSPRTNRNYKGVLDLEKKELFRNKSNKLIHDKVNLFDNIIMKKGTYDEKTQLRLDFLHNLHREKEHNIKKLETNLNKEKGITFKPKTNVTNNNNASNKNSYQITLTREISDKKVNQSLKGSLRNESALKQSNSSNHFSKHSSPRKTEYFKTTNMFTNNHSYFQNSPTLNHASSKRRYQSNTFSKVKYTTPSVKANTYTNVKTGSTKYSVHNSKDIPSNTYYANFAASSSAKSLINQENRINIKTPETYKPIVTKKEELKNNSFKATLNNFNYINTSLQDLINNNKCVTEYNPPIKNLNSLTFNPFIIENFDDKQILDIAGTYITTDESLEQFQKHLNENTHSNRISITKKKIHSMHLNKKNSKERKEMNKSIKLENIDFLKNKNEEIF